MSNTRLLNVSPLCTSWFDGRRQSLVSRALGTLMWPKSFIPSTSVVVLPVLEMITPLTNPNPWEKKKERKKLHASLLGSVQRPYSYAPYLTELLKARLGCDQMIQTVCLM